MPLFLKSRSLACAPLIAARDRCWRAKNSLQTSRQEDCIMKRIWKTSWQKKMRILAASSQEDSWSLIEVPPANRQTDINTLGDDSSGGGQSEPSSFSLRKAKKFCPYKKLSMICLLLSIFPNVSLKWKRDNDLLASRWCENRRALRCTLQKKSCLFVQILHQFLVVV